MSLCSSTGKSLDFLPGRDPSEYGLFPRSASVTALVEGAMSWTWIAGFVGDLRRRRRDWDLKPLGHCNKQ